MTFTIKSGELFDVLNMLKSYQTPIEAIPSTKDVLIEADEGLALGIFGSMTTALVSIPAEVKEPGKILITPSKILPALSRDKKNYVTIATNDKGQVEISWDAKTDLMVLESGIPETFYQFELPPKRDGIVITLDEAVRAATVFQPLNAGKDGFIQISSSRDASEIIATDEFVLSMTSVTGTASKPGDWFVAPLSLSLLVPLGKTLNIAGASKIRIQSDEQYSYVLFPGGFFRSLVPSNISKIPYNDYFGANRLGSITIPSGPFVKDIDSLAALGDSIRFSLGKLFELSVESMNGNCVYRREVESEEARFKVDGPTLRRLAKACIGAEIKLSWTDVALILEDDVKAILIGVEHG